jgi:hypothetical protein
MNINDLEKLAKEATPGPYAEKENGAGISIVSLSVPHSNKGAFVVTRCTKNRFGDAERNASYIAAANPSAILELISAYREAVAAIRNTLNGVDTSRRDCRAALATAKRLGIDQL